MPEGIAELALTLVATLLAAPLVMKAMRRQGVLDVPNDRSSHSLPVPRGGGLACLVGGAAGLLPVVVTGTSLPWALLVVALLLAFLGFLDDRRGLPAWLRLGAQLALGLVAGLSVGNGWWLLAGLLVVPFLVNAINFMDGINGITGLHMTLWGATALSVGVTTNNAELVTLGALGAGMALGFLPFNIPTAQLFLGDVGSYMFGGIVAGGVLVAAASDSRPAVVAAPVVLYSCDVLATLVRRLRRGARLTAAHREHTYQRLLGNAGAGHSRVAAVTTSLSAVIVVLWVALPVPMSIAGSALIGLLYLLLPRLTRPRPRTQSV